MKFNLTRLYKFRDRPEKNKTYNTKAKFVDSFPNPNREGDQYDLFKQNGVSSAIKAFKAAKNKKEHIENLAFLLNNFSPVNGAALFAQGTVVEKKDFQKFIGVEKYKKYLEGTGFQFDEFKREIEYLEYHEGTNPGLNDQFEKYKKDFLILLSISIDFVKDVMDDKKSLGEVKETLKRRYYNIVKQGTRGARRPNTISKARAAALEYLSSEEAYNEVTTKIIENFDDYQGSKKQGKLQEGFSERFRAVNEIFFAFTGMNLMQPPDSVNTFKGQVTIYPKESCIFNDSDVRKLTNTLKALKVEKIYATQALKREEFAANWAGSSSALVQIADTELKEADNIKDQIIRIKELIKGGEEAPKREEVPEPEPEVAAKDANDRGSRGRRRRVRRAGPTAASTYNIKKPPKDSWIGGYQNKLKSFYDKNAATKAIAAEINATDPGKLTDGRYGFRTHYVTIKAAENIISQLDEFLKSKPAANPAAAPAAAPAAQDATTAPAKPAPANERRIKQLSKLLETKLVGSELNLFNEQDTPTSEADKKKKLQALLAELKAIKQRLETAHNQNSIPKSDASVQGEDLARFNKILSMLLWNEQGKINFDEVYKKMQPAVAATKEPTKPAEEVVKRPSETSCFYAIDRTISGVQILSPIKIWALAESSWDKWYKEALELLEDEAASRQFYYLSGPQISYLGIVKSMDKNAAVNINLSCISHYMTNFLLNLEGNMNAAQALAQSGQAPVEEYSNFVGPNRKTFKNSRADKIAKVIRDVLKKIPELRKGQNKNAEVAGEKKLVVTPSQTATIKKAAAIAAKPSTAEKAAAKTPTAKALAKTFREYVSGVGAPIDPAQRAKRVETIINLMGGDGKTREAYLKKYKQITPELLDDALTLLRRNPTFMGYFKQARPGSLIGSPTSTATPAATPAATTAAEKAEAAAKAAADADAKCSSNPGGPVWKCYLRAGQSHYKQKAFDAAAAVFKSGLQKTSHFPLYLPLAYALEALGKYRQALIALDGLKGRTMQKLNTRDKELARASRERVTARIAKAEAGAARGAPKKESLKQKREKLLHEAIFKKLVK